MTLPADRRRYLALAERAQQQLDRRADPRAWIEGNLFIRTKDRRIIPFRYNLAQEDYDRRRTSRDLILKPRQLGFTTLICGLFFADALLRRGTTCAMIGQNMKSTEQIFGIVQLFWERLPLRTRKRIGEPRYGNRRGFYWPKIGSRFFVGTAGAVNFGRGVTIQNLHCSEFAIWPDPENALISALEAVPKDGRVVIESTANGMGNYFHDLWVQALEGRGRFKPQFYVWFEEPAYQAAITDAERQAWMWQLAHRQAIPDFGGVVPALSDMELGLIDQYHLSLEQIKWARLKRADLGTKFDQEYPTDPVSCFLASGRCIFDTQNLMAIARRIASEPQPESLTSMIVGGEAISLPPASLLVWKRPEPEHHYCIGADVGEGLADGDASCGVVLDRASGEQVAELHGRVSPERFAVLLNALGRYYRRADIGVERNNHGHSTLNTLRNVCLYPLLYYHVAYDSGHGNPRAVQLGWPTNSSTKPILTDDLAEAVNTGSLLVRDQLLVNEAMTFVLDDNGNAGAQPGKFDDRIMAAGIAWQVRKRPRPRMSRERPPGM